MPLPARSRKTKRPDDSLRVRRPGYRADYFDLSVEQQELRQIKHTIEHLRSKGDDAAADAIAQKHGLVPKSEPEPPAKPPEPTEQTINPAELKGEALDQMLEKLHLPKTGTADEKRARIAEALAAGE